MSEQETQTVTEQPAATAVEAPKQDKIIPALIKANGELAPIVKSRTANTGKFQYNFANVNDILAAVREVYQEHGLMLTFNLLTTERGIFPRLTVIHESGQERCWHDFMMPFSGTGPQDIVSISTYATRVQLCTALGIPLLAGDDDGARAQKNHRRSNNTGSAQLAQELGASETIGPNGAAGIKAELDELGIDPSNLRKAMKQDKSLPTAIIDGSPADWPLEWAGRVKKYMDRRRRELSKDQAEGDSE